MANSNYAIRPASEEDAPAIAGLFLEYGNPNDEKFDTASVRQVTENLLQSCLGDTSHAVYVVVDTSNTIVGYCAVHFVPFAWLQGTECYISELLVGEAARGQGIGSMILERVETDARERGCFRIMLNNQKAKDSYERQFYPKQGFVERDGIANYIKDLRSS